MRALWSVTELYDTYSHFRNKILGKYLREKNSLLLRGKCRPLIARMKKKIEAGRGNARRELSELSASVSLEILHRRNSIIVRDWIFPDLRE